MGEIAPFLVPITMFLTIGAVLIFRGPFGKALAERMAKGDRQMSPGDAAETEALRADVEDLRWRLGEVEERLDFTERVLARHKDVGKLPPGE
ncbi:MAG: hypothetical protein V3T74_13900 [Gemmatimonadales bacterium]|jgi:hypothetical protein